MRTHVTQSFQYVWFTKVFLEKCNNGKGNHQKYKNFW